MGFRWPMRRTTDLRQGRFSRPGTRYFVTFCTVPRASILATGEARASAWAAWRELVDAGDVRLLAATLMPDHVHMLFELGARLSLDRVVAKWKARVRPVLGGDSWQANYFEHRLRPEESAERYAWYIFMNPYRAGLVTSDEVWRGWWPEPAVAWELLAAARPGPCPQPEWLAYFDGVTRGLTTGESA